MTSVLIGSDTRCVNTEKRPCEDMVRRYPTGNQRERVALVETDPTDTLLLILML